MTLDWTLFSKAALRRPPALLVSAQLLGMTLTLSASSATPPKKGIEVVPDEAGRRVDILVDGQPFTSYIWPSTVKKPVLYPLRTARGTVVTRGFPLAPRPGERIDHPHHVGMWFNYGSVNGFDFWNNSDAIKALDAPKMGTIVHRAVTGSKNGQDQASLSVEMDWINGKGSVILKEATTFVFRIGKDVRIIDRLTTLTAQAEPVVFNDDKEGVIGIRVARSLEEPSKKPEVFTDAAGRPTTVATLDNSGVNGVYLSSEGKKGEEVWGTRGRWVILTGSVEKEPVTLELFDHPQNPGFPTYWHARGYGLFAANPLGQKVFSNGKEELNFAIQARAKAQFRYRFAIVSGRSSPEEAEAHYKRFVSEVE